MIRNSAHAHMMDLGEPAVRLAHDGERAHRVGRVGERRRKLAARARLIRDAGVERPLGEVLGEVAAALPLGGGVLERVVAARRRGVEGGGRRAAAWPLRGGASGGGASEPTPSVPRDAPPRLERNVARARAVARSRRRAPFEAAPSFPASPAVRVLRTLARPPTRARCESRNYILVGPFARVSSCPVGLTPAPCPWNLGSEFLLRMHTAPSDCPAMFFRLEKGL